MVWLIVVSAMVVMGLAVAAGTGRFGEMPEPVHDRPKPLIPSGPFGMEYLVKLRLPHAATGYDPGQVHEFLSSSLAQVPAEEPVFDVVPGGFDMQAVDRVVDDVMGAERAPAPSELIAPTHADEAPGAVAEPATPRRGASDTGDAE
ncbi:hypothetical protein [Arachnia propionica]|uniref:DivIVA domain-containing protein n=1 Tax=Arachnia propionica TaxID=1750 RepID=A0A3P1WZ05_9ACTN|nr:hypothetical protein [Arachnia propionica]RRD51415.1 hypothetical protein EII35_00590 [Arachnia propionica]